MIRRRQRQKGGSGSQQYQAGRDLILISTEEASKIASVLKGRVIAEEFIAEGAQIGSDRINRFDDKVIGEFSQRGLLQSFSEPAFQILLRKAQLHAAATSEDSDYELLTKLLAERAQQPSKPIHMVVTHAVEVIEQIDAQALLGMTLLWFVTGIVPAFPDPKTGLTARNSLTSKLIDSQDLPTGSDWLLRLDLMNCIRYQAQPTFLQSMKKGGQLLSESVPGYVSEGVLAEDQETIRSRLIAIRPGLESWLVPHCFLPGRFRINIARSAALLDMLGQPIEQLGQTDDFKGILEQARVDQVSPDATSNMLQFVKEELPHLDRVRAWWDNLEGIVQITPVGIAVAYSNVKRFDELHGLPSLPILVRGS